MQITLLIFMEKPEKDYNNFRKGSCILTYSYTQTLQQSTGHKSVSLRGREFSLLADEKQTMRHTKQDGSPKKNAIRANLVLLLVSWLSLLCLFSQNQSSYLWKQEQPKQVPDCLACFCSAPKPQQSRTRRGTVKRLWCMCRPPGTACSSH